MDLRTTLTNIRERLRRSTQPAIAPSTAPSIAAPSTAPSTAPTTAPSYAPPTASSYSPSYGPAFASFLAPFTASLPAPSTAQTSNPESLIQTIERTTQRKVTITRTLSPDVLARSCNPQDASPLYTVIPKEIRDLIFAFATTPTPDTTRAYETTDYWYRPDHPAPLRTWTALLQTCRRTWLETHALPLQQAENAFWFQRGPHDMHPDEQFRHNIDEERRRYHAWLERLLTAQGLHEVRHVRLFLQMYPFQELGDRDNMHWFFPMKFQKEGFRPRVFQITIRHSDWTDWEVGQRLDLQDRYVQYVLDAAQLGGVEQFKLELETLESKKDELEVIVQRLLLLTGKARRAEPTNLECQTASTFICNTKPTVATWTGPTNINGKHLDIFNGLDRLVYFSKTITWTNARFPITEQGDEKLAKYPSLPPESEYPWRIRGCMRARGGYGPRFHAPNSDPATFRQQQVDLWEATVHKAAMSEAIMRGSFEKAIRDEQTKRWRARWEREGSLLEFET